MAPTLVRHQHCSGSVWTSWADAAAASAVNRSTTKPIRRTIVISLCSLLATKTRKHETGSRSLLSLSCFGVFAAHLCSFSQAPLGDELAQRNRGLQFVHADAQDVEIRRLGP